MATNVVYRLVIESQGTKETKPSAQSEVTKQVTEPNGTDALKAGVKKIAGFYAGTSLVRTAVKTGVGLMDVYTGNDYQQRVIDGVINVAESVVGTGIAFALNPIAGVATIATKAISFGAEAQRKRVELYTQQLEAGLVRERAGGAFNRSRISGNF